MPCGVVGDKQMLRCGVDSVGGAAEMAVHRSMGKHALQRLAAVPDRPTAVPVLAGTDLAMALVLTMAALAVYAGLAMRLAQGQYSDFYNLAFDFDSPRYVALMVLDEHERGNVKHPLTWALRPFAWPLLAAGVAPKAAAGLVMAGFAAATVAVVFLYLRSLTVTVGMATALAVLFAVSGCQVFTAVIPEAYGPAAFAIACVWLLAVWRLADPRHARRLRIALATLNCGITTTNILQPMVAEALVWWRHRGLRGAVVPMIRYGLVVALCCAVLTAIVWFNVLRQFLSDPAAVAKEVCWQRTKGDRVGLADLILRLVGFTMVSPDFSTVRLPEGIAMWGFRTPVSARLPWPQPCSGTCSGTCSGWSAQSPPSAPAPHDGAQWAWLRPWR